MERKRLFITGSPRSGTRTVAQALRRAGFKVRHESMGREGTVCGLFCVDDYWYPCAHGDRRHRRRDFEFDAIWHLVRHPLKVIRSLEDLPVRIWHWQEKHTGIAGDLEPATFRAALFWLDWTERADKQSSWRFRIEDFEAPGWGEILERLNWVPRETVLTRVGVKIREPLSWDALRMLSPEVCERVQEKARLYGYEETT